MRGSENALNVKASRCFVKRHFWNYSYESTHGYSSTPSGLVMEPSSLLWSKVEKKNIGGEGPKHGAGRVVIRFIFPLADQLTASACNAPAQVSVHGEPKGKPLVSQIGFAANVKNSDSATGKITDNRPHLAVPEFSAWAD